MRPIDIAASSVEKCLLMACLRRRMNLQLDEVPMWKSLARTAGMKANLDSPTVSEKVCLVEGSKGHFPGRRTWSHANYTMFDYDELGSQRRATDPAPQFHIRAIIQHCGGFALAW
jgi:hypothetical protein